MSLKKIIRQKIVSGKLAFQLAFWALSFFILLRIFTRDYDNGTVDIIYTVLFHIPLVILVMINYVLINKLINGRKYALYAGAIVLLVGLGLLIHHIVFDILAGYIFSGYYFISLFSDWDLIQYFLVYLSVSLMLYLSKNWFELREKQAILEKENKEVQLQNLKAQLNPHFLFNSLNNIYALSNISDSRGREYLLNLSDALRYMLYKSDLKTVSLEEELEYLKNYIALEKLRLEEKDAVRFEYHIQDLACRIAPLILLPLIENAFKHVDKDSLMIDIRLILERNELSLSVRNSMLQNEPEDKQGGIGLANLQKRLDLLYPGKYDLAVDTSPGIYLSKLIIKI